MNYFLNLSNIKYIEKNLDITKPCYSKDILIAVPWPFITSRLHWIRDVMIQGWWQQQQHRLKSEFAFF